ncbi:bifunctional DNA primase/polymerase [Limnoglobus roseus]|uniref:DNA primase/polymerase bifunctional N-terminal domain-containing protein n=1 Tax=Limnoglobus roseus TaxID=2598579 RepID=A0A5C1AUL2_9BACT|nr:bifunctional DNA primase/polymerase [Limnoglobus roseus]QEL20468.1 hypothetical protein PX52LOC_07569 [Limnoglobus roseus]
MTAALTTRDYLQAALWYRSWGWACLPVSHAVADKRPTVRWKALQRRKPTDRELGRLFAVRPDRVTGLAVLLGRASGGPPAGCLACRDFDAAAAYFRWASLRPRLAAALPTVRTRRGFHVYCYLPAEVFVDFGPGDGDLRCVATRYAVLPPSAHPSGVRYAWVRGDPARPDFPLLTVEATGFLADRADKARSPGRPRTALTPAAQPARKADKDKDLLCPPRGVSDAAGGSPGPDARWASLPAAEREAVLKTLPRRAGERHRRLFELARRLADVRPGVPAGHWAGVVRAWWRRAEPVVRTKDWAVTWADFRAAWGRVRTPASRSPPAVALAAARGADVPPRDRLRLACRSLAGLTGGTFYLSARGAAAATGLGKTRAAELLAGLVAAGELIVRVPGRRSASARLATRYALGPLGD